MWERLRGQKLGFKFRREHPVGPYRLDFYCPEATLAVEMDGEQHDPAKDRERDAFLLEQGIFTYRIQNRRFFGIDLEVLLEDVMEEILKLCEERSGRRQRSP